MALTLYGSHQSRTLRVLWTAAELGLDYTHVPCAFDDPALKSAAFLAINPAGAIPTLVDGDVHIGESLAINLYLTKTYGAAGPHPLYPATAAGEAEAWRWTLWAQAHLEPWLQKDALLAELRAAAAPAAAPIIERSLGLLERVLADRDWLLGADFTVADLNVAGVLSPSRSSTLDLAAFPLVGAWLDRCYARPAARATRARVAAA
jgi:glutathione S-transferase